MVKHKIFEEITQVGSNEVNFTQLTLHNLPGALLHTCTIVKVNDLVSCSVHRSFNNPINIQHRQIKLTSEEEICLYCKNI